MKKKLLLWSMLICIFTIGNSQTIIDFPDANFKQALLNHANPVVDTNGDLQICIAEAEAVLTLDIERLDIIDLSGIEYFINLEVLDASQNKFTSEVDLSNNVNLRSLRLYANDLDTIDLSNNVSLTSLDLTTNNLTEIDLSNIIDLTSLTLTFNPFEGGLDLSNNTKLTTLFMGFNELTSIDVSKNIALRSLELGGNLLTSIDLSKNINIENLGIESNLFTQIDLSNNIALNSFELYKNEFTELDLSNNINLFRLSAEYNSFTELDLSNNPKMAILFLSNNPLTKLELSSDKERLYNVRVNNTELSTLDLRDSNILYVDFSSNPNLQSVFMTGQNSSDGRVVLNNCPNLQFICADQEYLNDIYSLLEDAGQISCQLSSDCLTPLNHIQGTITYDLDNDGCGDTDDVPFTGVFKINTFGDGAFEAFTNDQGIYNLFIPDGNFNLLPNINDTYFSIPDQVFSFPVPVPQNIDLIRTDYCIQPQGDFNDLEITIVPIGAAVPGFDTTYEITYSNIGTTTQSGSITLDYQDDVLTYNSSTTTLNSNSNGQLTWNFTDLQPMTSGTIEAYFTLNKPTDSPALNGGDVLDFTVAVIGGIDLTPENNEMPLAQTVVNSYDPNDKTCLEGDILDPDNVGGYLHYLIRFENEGTAEARNIRVTDVIDTTKLDIESLVPLKSSDSYTTTITNGNEVEFTFSNINLPFDDANNDGYVLFKIKTLDTLVEGDEIVNSAAIYFDYNFPIITEDSVVSIESEEIEELGFSSYFSISPNPTTDIINLEILDDSISISYILIYDLSGHIVGFYYGTTRTMDASVFLPNTYIMQIITDKGDFSTQFIRL